MLFNSLTFLIFGAIFFAVWPFVAKRSHSRWIWVCLASFFFYGWWDWRFLPLMIATALVDYAAGLGMVRFPYRRKLLLILSMGSNLAVLGLFKYWGLFARTLNGLLSLFGAHPLPFFDILLPLGISFYTFLSMSYTIDVYRGEIKPVRNVLHYLAYVSFFPHLVAGPIVRARNLLPQLETWKRPSADTVFEGLRLIVIGYFKKTVIADSLAGAVNQAFGTAATEPTGLYWWIVATMFSIQIYCDFAGYSDIARGLAKWMGYELPVNFDHPYSLATSLREFWARWHITLSTWFRDYLYIPLGGSRTGHAVRNILVTMALMGLWHGAAWNFVVFGLMHGAFLALERATRWPERISGTKMGTALSWVLMITQVWLAAAVFRCQSATQVGSVLQAMLAKPLSLSVQAISSLGQTPLVVMALAIVMEAGSVLIETSGVSRRKSFQILEPSLLAILIVASACFRGPGSAFVYFQF